MKKNEYITCFTLIELLVVISVIALLLTMLIPSLEKARRISKRAVCLSNLKQQGTGAHAYMVTNSSKIPMFINHHPNQLKRTPFDDYDGDLTQEFGKVTDNSFEILYCPLGELDMNTDKGSYGGYSTGYDWIFMSYNFVGFFDDGGGGTGWGNQYFYNEYLPLQNSNGRISSNVPISMAKIQNPDEVALSVDAQATFFGKFRGESGWPSWAGWEFYFGHEVYGQWEGASAVYFDGSARHGYKSEIVDKSKNKWGAKYVMNYNSWVEHYMFWK